MRLRRVLLRSSLFCGLFLSVFHPRAAWAQVRPRVVKAVDNAERVTLGGNVHPLARAEFDRGVVADSLPMNRILLLLKRGDDQEASLQDFLQKLQDKGSSHFHQWLTPEQFGAQFGPADSDVQAVTDWLTRQGFSINKVYGGKTVIEFSGTAGQVQRAFGTDIRNYQVNGKLYSANATDPQIPSALAPVVTGIVSLHNFPKQFHLKPVGVFSRGRPVGAVNPSYTAPAGGGYFVTPADFATIYNTAALLSTGNDGTGQSIAIVGETDINVSDIQNFRQLFHLPANFTGANVIVNGEDPGVTSKDEEAEADLDVEWSGAVAPGAQIKFITSSSTASTAGIDLSALYILEHNLAAVMSESYGACEQSLGSAGNAFYKNLWAQASAQGITAVVSAGDGGSAGCDDFGTQELAIHGLAVSGLASTPYNVSVGGTDFDQQNNWTQFWTNNNDPISSQSALGYIPEFTWNDSCADAGLSGCSGGANLNIVAGSGGPSTIYGKPSWQVGTAGMPTDSKRDQPDVSLFSGNGKTGSAYIICQADVTTPPEASCNLNIIGFTYEAVGGTSAAAPAFAGIMALVNQKTGSRQGNANDVLYQLAKGNGAVCNATQAAATGNACSFYDVTKGNNSVPCPGGLVNCSSKSPSLNGVMVDSTGNPAWSTNAGYDMATGLGTLNGANLAQRWNSVATIPTSTTLSLSPTTNISHGTNENVAVTIHVSETNGNGIPSGSVSLLANLPDGTHGLDEFPLSNGSANGVKTNSLPGGTYSVVAYYSGDGTNAPSQSSPAAVTVNSEASKAFIVVPVYDPISGNLQSGNASSVPYGGIYRIRVYITNNASVANPSGPPHPTCDQVNNFTCPTGTVTLSANGQPVDGANGIYQLNNIGYTRDINPTLSAGSFSLQAQYSGDPSYQSSSITSGLTVTPAPTTTIIPTNDNVVLGTVGVPFNLNEIVQSNSFGAIETGTITIYDGGTPTNGNTAVWNSQTGAYSQGHAFIQATTTFSFTTPGTHVLTAKYSGDANYSPSTSGSFTVSVNQPTTITATASSLNIIAGNTITLTAIVDTTVKSPTPSPNVGFFGTRDGNFSGKTTYSPTTDAQGNAALQASLVVTPSDSQQIWAVFGGDSTFQMSASNQTPLNLTVVTPDFSINPTQVALTVIAGQSASTPITVMPATNLTSQVQFTLQGFSNYATGLTCSVTPSPVSLSGQQAATASFGCSSPAASATTTSTSFLLPSAGQNTPRYWWIPSGIAVVLGSLLLLLSSKPRIGRVAMACYGFSAICLALGCGGGGGSSSAGGGGTGGGGSGGGGGPTQTPTSITLSIPSTKIATNSALVATITVSGTHSPTGTVTLWDNTTSSGMPGTLVNGQAQVSLNLGGVGAHSFIAQYSGDSKNLSSQTQTPLVEVVTGTTGGVWINASTGTDVKQINVTLTVQ